MGLTVTFRNLNAREEVRRRALALYEKVERFVDPAADASLVLSAEHGRVTAEVTILSRGTSFTATADDDELRSALDRAMHTIEEQLRRDHDRRTDRRAGPEVVDGFVASE
jgi:ribosomal subunit interface protein